MRDVIPSSTLYTIAKIKYVSLLLHNYILLNNNILIQDKTWAAAFTSTAVKCI
jgi:hypothetical protein